MRCAIAAVLLLVCCSNLLLVACDDGAGASGDLDSDTDTDTDSDGDSDTDSDTDGDSDADTDSDGDCTTLGGADGESFDHEYDVGPGQEYEHPGEVPWESLEEGTLVRIHYRTQPYAAKWVLNTIATADKPLVVRGVMEGDNRPVITGEDAVTRLELSYWNENRSVIKIGGSNLPSDDLTPAYIRVENLDIRSARPAYQFTNDDGGTETYSSNAAAVHIERGDHITIHNCLLHDAGNGLFSGHGSSSVLITGNHVYDNGIEGSYYEHNSYTESFGITFQYNYYGPLRTGCDGNNLKDRSAGTAIRFNWIEAGNRQLDLVESDYDDFVNDPSYQETFVYGNVLVEPDGAGNSQMVHYGGDGGDESMYRTGTIYFYNNTVVSTRSGNTTLFRLSTDDVDADARNNIIYSTAGGGYMAICSGSGNPSIGDNWLPSGWTDTHESSMSGTLTDLGNIEGSEPGFQDLEEWDLTPAASSQCIDGAGALPAAASQVSCHYVAHQQAGDRPTDGALDVGAYERE